MFQGKKIKTVRYLKENDTKIKNLTVKIELLENKNNNSLKEKINRQKLKQKEQVVEILNYNEWRKELHNWSKRKAKKELNDDDISRFTKLLEKQDVNHIYKKKFNRTIFHILALNGEPIEFVEILAQKGRAIAL